MCSSLLLQQCPACVFRLIWMVFEMGGRWPYICCFLGYCFQDLFNIARSILGHLPSSFSPVRLVSVHVVHPYRSIDTTTALKKLRFILLDFHMTDNLSIPSLVAYWYHFPLMRRCYRCRLTCLLISEDHRLVWRCHPFN